MSMLSPAIDESFDSGSSRPTPTFGTRPSRDRQRRELTKRLLSEIALTSDETERKRLEQEVVVANMPVAKQIARRYSQRGIGLDDLEQVACVGLVLAVQRFDPGYGRDFLSYAVPNIMGEVKRHFRDCGWAVRPPRRIQELQGRTLRATSDLAQTLGRAPNPREVAAHLELDVADVTEALSANGAFAPSSLDMLIGEKRSPSLGKTLVQDDEREIERAEARIVLTPMVRNMAARDRRILELRFVAGWTQQQIAEDIDVTQMHVSRMLARILRELRSGLS